MSQQRLVLQLQGPCPQLRPLHLFLQSIDISPLPINSTKELVLFFVNVCVPGMIAICHSLHVHLDLSQVFLQLVLLLLETISLEVNHSSVQLLERRVETYPSPLSGQKTPESPHEHGGIPHGLSRAIPGLVDNARINDTPAQ